MKKEMKTLMGYEIVDEKAREEINIVSEKAYEALSLAKGATKAFVYDTYSDMISELNQLDKAELLVNYHIMIRTVCVPDLWISGVSDEHVEYTYTSNEDFIADLTEDGVVQVGYFVLSALETQKVDLSEYVKKDDYVQDNVKGGIVQTIGQTYGVRASINGLLIINCASKPQILSKASAFLPITPNNIDYAVKVGLIDNKEEWTDEEKTKALELLGGVERYTPVYKNTNFVYAVQKDASGNVREFAKEMSGSVKADTIPITGVGGVLRVGNPTMDEHATTKKYVDDLVAGLRAEIETLKG